MIRIIFLDTLYKLAKTLNGGPDIWSNNLNHQPDISQTFGLAVPFFSSTLQGSQVIYKVLPLRTHFNKLSHSLKPQRQL